MLLDNLRVVDSRYKLSESPIMRNDRWATAKIILRSTALVLAVVALFESAFLSSGPADSRIPAVLSVASVCVLWDAAEFFTVFRRGDRLRGIKPAAHIGAEAILSIGGCLATALQVSSTLRISSMGERPQEHKDWLSVSQTLCGVLSLLSFMHFMLCLRSFVEVRRIREHKRIKKLILALSTQNQASQGGLTSILPPHEAPSSQKDDTLNESRKSSPLPVPEIDSKEIIQELSAVECFELPADDTFRSNRTGHNAPKE
ncbi:hypothetical protein NCS52_01312500 [Fusarium sp. LHS14.1]|nr:hypothetical protein NCS52_01312500 [Fusarium sp. LHS14.1]